MGGDEYNKMPDEDEAAEQHTDEHKPSAREAD